MCTMSGVCSITATMFSATCTIIYVVEKCNLKVSKDSWQLGKTAVVKLGACIVSADRKTTIYMYSLELC